MIRCKSLELAVFPLCSNSATKVGSAAEKSSFSSKRSGLMEERLAYSILAAEVAVLKSVSNSLSLFFSSVLQLVEAWKKRKRHSLKCQFLQECAK